MNIRTKAELYLLACTIIWGGTFVAVKAGLDDASPLLFLTVRFVVATVLFLPFVYRSLKNASREAVTAGVILGGLLALGFVFQTVGLQYTSASKSGFITGLLVVFTPLFQVLIERKAPRPGTVVGVVCVVIGLFLLTTPEGSSFNIGDTLTLLCAAVFGLYIVYLDVFTQRYNVWLLTLLQFVTTLLVVGLGALFFETPRIAWTQNLLISLGYLAILATIVTLSVQTRYQKDSTPARAAIIFSLEPVIAAGFAYLFRNENIGWLGVLGGGFIVSGLMLSELSDVFLARRRSRRRGGSQL